MSNRTRFTAEQKVQIVREHLENKVSVSQLSEAHGLNPNVIYIRKNDLFEGALKTFSCEHSSKINKYTIKIKHLASKAQG